MQPLVLAIFIKKITPELISLALTLYRRFDGDIVLAKEQLRYMQGQWAEYDKENQRIDQEMEMLKKEGK